MSLSDYATFLLDQLRGPRGEGVLLPAEEYRRLQGPGCNPAMAYGWGISEDGTLRHAGSNGMWYAEAALWSDEGLAMAIVSNDGRVDHQRVPSSGSWRRSARPICLSRKRAGSECCHDLACTDSRPFRPFSPPIRYWSIPDCTSGQSRTARKPNLKTRLSFDVLVPPIEEIESAVWP